MRPYPALALLAATVLLSACASRQPNFDQPRLGVVIELRSTDGDPSMRVMQAIQAAQWSVADDAVRRHQQGDSLPPQNAGEFVPGMVENAKLAVADSCSLMAVVQFDDDHQRLAMWTRCDQQLAVGQRVSVVRNAATINPRDVLRISVVGP